MPLEPKIQRGLLAAVPDLRAFAISLSGSVDRADDLVQETLLRAIAHIGLFTPGTNLQAWLTTILRNVFLNDCRKQGRVVDDPKGYFAATLTAQPAQETCAQVTELRTALAKLPLDQREAIILVGGRGLSYEEAAEICECAVGTIKSRTSRARARLAQLMSIKRRDDIGPSAATQAALCSEHLRWAA